jgi:hypothetical protein
MAGVNSIQTVGDFVATFSHPKVLSIDGGRTGVGIPLHGFKLEDVFVSTAQAVENSKMVPLVDGGTVSLTNSIKAGRVTINALRTVSSAVAVSVTSGDIVVIANALQADGMADNQGGTIMFSYGFNGAQETIIFEGVTLVSVPPLLLAGNDLPVYPVVFNYGSYKRNGA